MQILVIVSSVMLVTMVIAGTGCKPAPRSPIDSDKALQMLLQVPNSVSTPNLVFIYSTGMEGPREAFRQFSVKDSSELLVYRTTNSNKIASMVAAMRADASASLTKLPERGITYHLLLSDRASHYVLSYIFFRPSASNDPAYLRPNAPSGYVCAATNLEDWFLKENLIDPRE